MQRVEQLDYESERKLQQYGAVTATVVAVVTLLAFWAGIYFLKNEVFKDYYNPARHVIVQQDPETLEVYSWKDSANHLFTRDSASVRLFPYGVMVLILLLIGFSYGVYNYLTQFYAARIVREAVGGARAPVREQRRAVGG
ncbi:MAG: hypothetical protein AB1426_10615 [Bacillota bacterium]